MVGRVSATNLTLTFQLLMDQCVRVPLIFSLDLLGVDVEKSRFMMTLIFFDSLHSSTLDMQSFSSCVDVGLCI